MTRFGAAAARTAAEAIRRRIGAFEPAAAIVLGSGLGGLSRDIDARARIPYREIPGFPDSTVTGHAGELIVGSLCGMNVVALAGRFHVYEGHDVRLAAFPARVTRALGARTLIVSNAAGGINRLWQPGDLMLIRDHINLMFRNPLIGAAEDGDLRFPDMSEPYDRALAALALRVAAEQGILIREGVYAALLGPAYETPAEVRMLEFVGADAVGMSTVPEVVVARAIGMRVLGISCITNLACGLSVTPITHEEVLATTEAASDRFAALVRGIVQRL